MRTRKRVSESRRRKRKKTAESEGRRKSRKKKVRKRRKMRMRKKSDGLPTMMMRRNRRQVMQLLFRQVLQLRQML